MSTHNIGFYEDLTQLSLNYHQISSNTHLISSADLFHVLGVIPEFRVAHSEGIFFSPRKLATDRTKVMILM